MDKTQLKNVAVIIGMPRAGTTWIYENFRNHPEVCVSALKEINGYLLNFNNEQYLSHFTNDNRMKLDISPLYFFDLNALLQINRNHNKVIIIVREKRDWIKSLNAQIQKYGGDIGEYVKTGIYKFPIKGKIGILFNYGLYNQEEYINLIEKIFGNKLLKLHFKAIEDNPLEVLRTIEEYLGLKSYFSYKNSYLNKVNAGNKKISRLYVFLLKTRLLSLIIPIIITIFPQKIIHWIKRKTVYGVGR